MQYLKSEYIEQYNKEQKYTLHKMFKNLAEKKSKSRLSFAFYVASSSIYSSLIEGSNIDEATFMRYKEMGITGNKDFKQINNLIDAYNFAQTHTLTLDNSLKAHSLLSKNLVDKKYQEKYRDKAVAVYQGFLKRYEASKVLDVKTEMKKLFVDIKILLEKQLTYNEVFYYAAMIHLSVTEIHPFADGNGRVARLLEKWFLAQKLGKNAWLLQSEKMYFTRRDEYYKTIHLGSSYYNLDYTNCVKFLILLPQSFKL